MELPGVFLLLLGLFLGVHAKKNLTLDISNIDETHVVSTEITFSDSSLYTYKVIPDVFVTDIVYGETAVWKYADDGYEFLNAFLVSSNNSPSIIHVILENAEKVQKLISSMLVNGKWVPLDANAKALLTSALGTLSSQTKNAESKTSGIVATVKTLKPQNVQDFDLFFTFDVSKTDKSHLFNVGNYRASGLGLTIYNPKPTSHIVGIVDGSDIMWQKSAKDEECGDICLYSKSGEVIFADILLTQNNVTYFLCFEKTENGWKEIPESEFRVKIIAHSTPGFVFDISLGLANSREVINKHLVEERRDTGNLSYVIYRPKENVIVSGLVDGKLPIWSRKSSDEECVDIVLHASGGDFMAAIIIVMKTADYDTFFYKKNGNSWIKVNEREYEAFLSILKNGQVAIPAGSDIAVYTARPAEDEFIELDISNQEDSDAFQVIDYTTSSAIVTALFVPNEGYTVSNVSDDGELVWTPKLHEKCAKVLLHNSINEDLLMHVTSNTGSEYFFVKANGELWKEISKTEFGSLFHNAKFVDVELDMTVKVNRNRFEVFEAVNGEKDVVTYVPKTGYRISKVVHGTVSIWEKSPDQECTGVTLISKNGTALDARLIILDTKVGTIRYNKHITLEDAVEETEEPVSPSKAVTLEHHEPLAIEYPVQKSDSEMVKATEKLEHVIEKTYREVEGATLDLNMCVSDANIDVINTAATGKSFTLFNSVSKVPITTVVDGDFTIWRSINGAYCLSASTLIVDGKPALVELFIKDLTSVSRVHFAKLYYTWANVSEKSFTASVERLTAGQEEKHQVKEDSFHVAPVLASLVFLFFAVSA
ncbi:signal peptide-containing protein [Theileria equi strain WA]|uniref:Signal peptide-containing protein n=1 Tax=Theileria equi strain WA TaxID=1537102 RepID=L0AX69_THEEQ|nr:signal peptide-containing protein [Theileria equi strain WA]AFZ80182.1 signal peptide-containing protein [Theileria equi strain WA]|eukprot:XP_004829848.1 signal peptide-containing protein [Theileria equi strain WA]